jgi:hypothetical protein
LGEGGVGSGVVGDDELPQPQIVTVRHVNSAALQSERPTMWTHRAAASAGCQADEFHAAGHTFKPRNPTAPVLGIGVSQSL